MNIVIRIVETIGWSFLGVLLLYGGVRIFDLLDPIDYQAEVRKGNMAAGVILGAIILGLSAIVISVIMTP